MTIARPIVQPICQPILRSPLDGARGDFLTTAVKAMFASGEKGVLFDLTRAANLYTDSARTTLVTASGDAIGSATDLSPNGKHASSTGGARPAWSNSGGGAFGATTDAFDDYLQTAAVDFSATDKITVVVALRKSSDASTAIAVELGSDVGSLNGTFSIRAPRSPSTPNYGFLVRGASLASMSGATFAAPITNVVACEFNLSGPSIVQQIVPRIDGVTPASSSAGSTGGGSYGNYALNIGSLNAASGFLNGRIYRLLVIGRALTTIERNLAERWAAQPVGITIP